MTHHRRIQGRKGRLGATRATGGRPPHTPTAETRAEVERLAGVGMSQVQIAVLQRVSKCTLRKYYARELERGAACAGAKVSTRLFERAMEGDTAALIHWTKTRLGWRDTSSAGRDGNAHIPPLAGNPGAAVSPQAPNPPQVESDLAQ